MFGRKKDTPLPVVVVEVTTKDKPSQYIPLKTRDPQALVIADLLLNTPIEDGELPADLKTWAEQTLGRTT